MPQVVARGVRTHYQQLGSGPDLVLVHGLGANLAFWYVGAAPLLAAATGSPRTTCGGTVSPPGPPPATPRPSWRPTWLPSSISWGSSGPR